MIIGSCSGSLYALDRATGDPVWVYDTRADGSPAEFHGEAVLLGDRLIVPTDTQPKGHLYSFDLASGELLWKLPFPSGVATTPLLVGDRLYAVSVEGDVVSVEPKSGRIVWRVTPAGALKPRPFPSLAYAPKRILVADNTNQVLALDPANGATLWRKTLSGRANASLIVVGDEVVVGTADGYLHWLAVQSGEVKKRMKLEGMPYGTPVRSDGLLFVLVSTGKSKLIALDVKSHEVRWEQETAKEWTTFRPLVAGSLVMAGNEDQELCAFDRTSGERKWCRKVGQTPRGLGLSADGILYVGSVRGLVQAFRINPAAGR